MLATPCWADTGMRSISQQELTNKMTHGRPVLSWAATAGYVEIVEYLLTVPDIGENLGTMMGEHPYPIPQVMAD
jgi:hypothetical protein